MSDKKEIEGIGAIPHAGGIAFRVWAPHAQRVSVMGSFNEWDDNKHPMKAGENAPGTPTWPWLVPAVSTSSCLRQEQGEFKRIGPYPREVTHSVDSAIVHVPSFEWE